MKKNIIASVLITVIVFTATAQTDNKKVFTAVDYDKATKFLSFNTNKLVYRNNVSPVWLDDGRLWYSVNISGGKEFVLINPADGSRKTGADLKSILPDATNDKAPAANNRRGGGSNEVASPDGKKKLLLLKTGIYG